jgi:ubiquitin carboxyl-terminal hydrolase 7
VLCCVAQLILNNERTEEVGQYRVRLPKESTVADVLNDLKKQIGVSANGRQMRLLEIYYCKIYKARN